MENKEAFTLPLAKDWTESNYDALLIIQQKGEARLANTVQHFNRLYDRIFRYLSILIPVATLIIYLLYSEIMDPGSKIPGGAWPAFVVVIGVCGYCIWRLSFLQLPHKIYNPGWLPSELSMSQYLASPAEAGLSKEEQLMSLAIGQVRMLQTSINENEKLCSGLQRRLTQVQRTVTIVFILSALVLLGFAAWGYWAA